MKEFWKYFLGQGDTVEFENFSLTHLLMILSGVLVIYIIYLCRNRIAQYRFEPRLRYLLAFALIFSEMSYYWRLIAIPSLGPNPIDHLPISVCGWAVIFCSYMVVGKSQTLFDISYFWLLSGSLFALLTPTVITYTGPTRFRFYQFWLEHLLGYVAIFYMIFVHKMRPTIKSAAKSYIALLVLAVIAYSTNQMLGPGANYLFMARPEATPSVLDILPPNFVLRIAVMVAVITLMFGLAYLPWYLKDRKAKKSLPTPATSK
jgi:hypothetical integral membrane protein (TIGR02206 family)